MWICVWERERQGPAKAASICTVKMCSVTTSFCVEVGEVCQGNALLKRSEPAPVGCLPDNSWETVVVENRKDTNSTDYWQQDCANRDFSEFLCVLLEKIVVALPVAM